MSLRVSLVNLPFASVNLPSFALAQIYSVCKRSLGDRISAELLYLNQEFVHTIGLELNQYIVETLEANNTGIGDWLFRQVAFPDAPDNSAEYLKRYYPYGSDDAQRLKYSLLETRAKVDRFLDEAIERHGLASTGVLGLTSMFSQNVACFALARKVKEKNPSVTVVMGGANCETPMGEEIARNVPAVDYVFSGPALKSFPELLRCVLENDRASASRIRGVFTRQNLAGSAQPIAVAGQVGRAGEIGEELPISVPVPLEYEPFFAALDANFPDGSVRPRLNFETSRGCWWGQRAHCTFCGLNGTTMTYRTMPPELALEQFHSLFSRYGGRVTRFESVDNILPRNYVEEVFSKLEPRSEITLFYEVKADLTGRELEILSRAGVKELQPGIEALATSTLKLMKKGTTVFTNLALLKNCLVHGVYPFWNLLIGFPGEKEDVYRKYLRDFPLLTHLSPPDGVNPVRFDRYSPYFRDADAFGLDLNPYDYYGLIYPFEEASLHRLAYYFMDHNIDAEYFVNMARWIDPIRKQVERWRLRWVGKPHDQVPKLYVEKDERGGARVFDSRSEKAVEYPIGERTHRVLKALAKPLTRDKLAGMSAQLGGISELDLEEELAALSSRGLLFEEDGRLMSLGLESPPKPVSGRTLYGLEI